MSATRLVIVGGGEHARVVAEAARSSGRFTLLGFTDPAPCVETVRRLGLLRLGDDGALEGLDAAAVLGVGEVGPGDRRRAVVERLGRSVRSWSDVVHAASWVSPTASLEEGAVVMAGAIVNAGARLGRHCVVNTGAVVEHDVHLGDFAQVAPGAVIGGGSTIGEGAFVGLGAAVRDHVRIGAGAFIGMGAIVVADVPAGARMRGPAAEDRRRSADT